MSKDLEDMAKKMLAMSQKKGGGQGIKNNGKPGPSLPSKVKVPNGYEVWDERDHQLDGYKTRDALDAQANKEQAQTVKKAEPKNATQKPAKNKAAQPKKNVAEEASDLMAEEVAAKEAKVKAAKAPTTGPEQARQLKQRTGVDYEGEFNPPKKISDKVDRMSAKAEKAKLANDPMARARAYQALPDSEVEGYGEDLRKGNKAEREAYRSYKKIPEVKAERDRAAKLYRPEPRAAMDAADADAVFTEGPSKTGLPHDLNAEADRIKSKLRAAGEYPPDAPGLGTLERDLPKGGRAVMKEAAELAPGAAEQSVMRGIRDKTIGRMSAKSLGGAALLGGVAGVGLQALMESLDAEEAGDPHEGHLSNSQDHAAIEMADKAANKQTATAINTGRLKPPTKHEPFYEDGNPTDQQKMEDEFAKQLQRYPR